MGYTKFLAYFKIKVNNDDIFGLSCSCIIVCLQVFTTDKVKSSHKIYNSYYGESKTVLLEK